MPKLCLITTVHQATDIRIFEKEAKSLLKRGYEVSLIAPYHKKEGLLEGVTIKGISKPNNRLVRWLQGWPVMFMALAEKADAYHFHDPEFILQGLCLQKISRKPVIYDVHEYYSQAVLTKPWVPGPFKILLSRLVEVIEKQAARIFSGIITVNDHMKEIFLAANKNTVSIYNYPFIKDFNSPRDEERTLDDNDPIQERKNRIIYLGGLSKVRGLATIIDALPKINGLEGKTQFCIAGKVNFTGLASQYKREWGVMTEEGRIKDLGQIPYREIPVLLKECQIAWLPWLPTPNNVLGTPTKLLEYMAAGKAVVASDMGFMAQIISKARCGFLVPPDNPEAHARAIEHLFKNPLEANLMGLRGQRAFLVNYNWESQEKKLIAFYGKVFRVQRRSLF